jgi:serine protease inhibitor
MRCLILIALSLVVASATYTTRNRFNQLLRGYGGVQNQFDDFESEYQPRRRLGGLHDIIGQGFGQDEEECNDPWNQGQCQDDDEEQFGRVRWGRQNQGDESEDELFENQQFGQGPRRQNRRQRWGQQQPWGQSGQFDQEDQYEQQGGEEFGGEYENEIDEIGFGGQSEQLGGQCSPNVRVLPKLENINCHLATGLYKQARRQNDDKNIVVSPTAVLLGLGVLNVGAKGHTKKEIGLVGGERPVVNGLSALLKMLKKGGQSQSMIDEEGIEGQEWNQGQQWGRRQQWGQQQQQQQQWGQGQQWGQDQEWSQIQGQGCQGRRCAQIKPFVGLFLSKATPVQRQFIQKVQGCLGVKVQKCDFQRQPQQCRQQINQWVSSKTQHKMPRLVAQDAITDNTKMLVVSGLQLKAQWGKQFKNHQTSRGIFHPLDCQKPKLVQVMQKRGVFKYHEDDLVKVVGIPTQGEELTMFVILPKCKKCLLDIEKEQLLEGDQLKRLLDNCDLKKQQVNVRLPKFQIKHKLDAKLTLLNKGMITMCEQNTADFSGITGCSECSQKAKYNLRRPLGQRNQMGESQQIKQAQIHLNKFLTQANIKISDQGISSVGPQDNQYQGQEDEYEQEQYGQQGQYGQEEQYGNQFQGDEIEGEDEMYNDRSFMSDRFEEITGISRYGQGQLLQKQFNVKHPFAFVVRHNKSKQLLLIGRVIDAGQKCKIGGQQMQDIFPGQMGQIQY